MLRYARVDPGAEPHRGPRRPDAALRACVDPGAEPRRGPHSCCSTCARGSRPSPVEAIVALTLLYVRPRILAPSPAETLVALTLLYAC
eukprot:8641708-Alexandrium_andersonii.AAC.1